ncbi:MAG: DUF2490 domain-containing protein [Robiginitalea sp.]
MSKKPFEKNQILRAGRLFALLLLMPGLLSSLGAQETGEIHTEAQFRYYETLSEFNQLLLRTGLNYHISEKAIATLGYAYIDTDPTYEDSQDLLNDLKEHRIFQQFILLNKVGKFNFEHRYRLEQRFLDIEGEKDTRHRVRYRLQLTFPLSQTFFLNFYDEIFLNLQDDIFNQNRLYAALGYRFSKKGNIQVGYLKNHFDGINFDRLQFAIFYNPDLRSLFQNQTPD